MSTVGQPERHSQNRIVQLFRQQLLYDYLGNREDRFKLKSSKQKEIKQGMMQVLLTGKVRLV